MSASLEKPPTAVMQSRSLILLVVLAALLPAPASGAGVRLAVRDEPLGAARSLQASTRTLPARQAPFTFNLAGLHWRGGGSVWFRTRADGGVWSAWNLALPEGEDLPDAGSAESGLQRTWRLGNPWWTGPARWIQYRTEGEVTRLRAYFLFSAPVRARRLALAGTPSIIPRAGWGADESIVRAPPAYATRIRLAVVHHTAGSNDYSPAESAAIVRGIEVYHVKANGWNDIGYNFLVDKYGQVFEGRAGGVDRNVIGAHVQGFNTGSVGVAILGNYQGTDVTPEALSALEALLAWRLDVAHVDPLATPQIVSGGNERFPAGTVVTLRAISGHRDAGDTECPGDRLYAWLPDVAQAVASAGLPKLYEPAASPDRLELQPDGSYAPIAFTARLSAPLPWTVTVSDGDTGTAIASGSGSGETISWTWNGTGPDGRPVDPAHAYVATFAAGDEVLPATVALSGGSAVPTPLDITGLAVAPGVVSPNGDGSADTARISFGLSAAARVRVRLEDAQGATVAPVMTARTLTAGPVELKWGGVSQTGEAVPDGAYNVVVVATANDQTVARSAPLVVDRTLGALTVTPRSFSPNGDGRRDTLSIGFTLASPAQVRVLLRQGDREIATIAAGALAAGAQRVSWDGALPSGRLGDGRYVASVEATTGLGTRRLGAQVVVDTTPPVLALLSAVSRKGSTKVRFSLSERARITIWTDAGATTIAGRAGRVTFSAHKTTTRVRLRAWDLSGNASKVVRVRARA